MPANMVLSQKTQTLIPANIMNLQYSIRKIEDIDPLLEIHAELHVAVIQKCSSKQKGFRIVLKYLLNTEMCVVD